jgi:subtilase family serine protease
MKDQQRRIGASLLISAVLAVSLGASPSVAAGGTSTNADLEAVCPPAKPGAAECLALRRKDLPVRPASAVTPASAPSGYGPTDIQSAYALPAGSAGSGITIAVVDAYDAPTAETDLATYRSQFGLTACTTANGCFRKVDQNGGMNYPARDSGWGLEIALDLDMVSAACPSCKILLVEARSSSIPDLGTAVDTAVSLGAAAVSNSYGGPEWAAESLYDYHYNHPGVAITVATGDCGYNCAAGPSGNVPSVEYPSASQYVVAVGGTTLTRDHSVRGWTEQAWGHGGYGAGSGCSAYESKPSWQHDGGCVNRTLADVSALADPSYGVAVYSSDAGGWGQYGGTSAATPVIAAAYALAGGIAAGMYPASYPYRHPEDLNDAVGGNNNVTGQTCTVTLLCNGVIGYDGPTGLGTPNGIGAFTAPRSTYHELIPTRILDTRNGTGGLSGPFTNHVARTFTMSGVPGNATAVTGNLTVTGQTSGGYLYIGPVAANNPTSSTLNFPAGDDRSNAVTVALSPTGTLSITYVAPSNGPTAQAIFDVTGYFTPDTSGATYHATSPARVLDTRVGTGLSGPFGSHAARTFQVTGNGGVPANATAVTGNLTVTGQTSSGYLFIGPVANNNPTSSTLNFPVGDDRANAVTVALGTGGTLSVTYVGANNSQSAQVIFDVTGYFVPDA